MQNSIIPKYLIFFFLIFFVFVSNDSVAQDFPSQSNQKKSAEALLKRVIPSHAKMFSVEIISKENDKDVFEIESIKDKVILRGSSAVSVASALNWYLKYDAHCQLSWNGDNLNLPAKLPVVAKKLRKITPCVMRWTT